jgi:hypothetical protein
MLSQNEQRYDYRTFECSPFRRRKDLLRENTGGIDRCDSRCQRDFPHEALGDFPVPPDSAVTNDEGGRVQPASRRRAGQPGHH